MPYIKKEQREMLDPKIDLLAGEIYCQTTNDMDVAGLLNYCITELMMRVVKQRFYKIRYYLLALMSGVLHNVDQELYRRVASKYEEKQIEKSGDIFSYSKENDDFLG